MTMFYDCTGAALDSPPNQVRVGVSGVIFDNGGRVLLEKRSDNGHWGLPGGGVDIGESVEHAIVREVFEETSLIVEIERLVGVYSDPQAGNISSYPDGNIVHWVTIAFECSARSGDLRYSAESTDLRYFAFDEMPPNTLESHRQRVGDAIARHRSTVVS